MDDDRRDRSPEQRSPPLWRRRGARVIRGHQAVILLWRRRPVKARVARGGDPDPVSPLVLGSGRSRAPEAARPGQDTTAKNRRASMPKFVIERNLPGAGKLSAKELQAISQKSNAVLRSLGPEIQWVQSYVTDDKIYCVYVAPSEELIRKHAKEGGFPADRITPIRTMIDPTTAE
jgi:hypothetical protein